MDFKGCVVRSVSELDMLMKIYGTKSGVVQRRCPVCGGDSHAGFVLADQRRGLPGRWSILNCPACGCAYHEKIHEETIIRNWYAQYSNLNASTHQTGEFAKWHKRLFRVLKGEYLACDLLSSMPVREVLEIGAGGGHHILSLSGSYVRKAATDFDHAAIARLVPHGLDARVMTAESEAPYGTAEFDLILSMQVIEHVQNQRAFCREVNRLLRPGGLWLIATPNAGSFARKLFGVRWVSGWYPPYHLIIHSRRSLVSLIEECGFEVVRCSCQTPAYWFARDLVAMGRSKCDHIEKLVTQKWFKVLVALVVPICRIMDIFATGSCMNYLVRKRATSTVPRDITRDDFDSSR